MKSSSAAAKGSRSSGTDHHQGSAEQNGMRRVPATAQSEVRNGISAAHPLARLHRNGNATGTT